MRNIKRWWVVALATVSLAGCFDLNQEITVEHNELTYTAELKMDAKLAAMANKQSGGFCDEMAQSKSEGIHVEVKESMGGGNLICTITAKGPLDKFNHYVNSEKDNAGTVQITRLDDGKYRIESQLKNDKQTDMAGAEGMFDAMFAGRSMSWRINAPKIVESNGQISDDKRHVSWSVPIAQAMKSQQRFYAVIENETSWWRSIVDFFAGLWQRLMGLFATTPKVAPAATPVSAAPSAPPANAAPQPAPLTQAPVTSSSAPADPQGDSAAAAPAPQAQNDGPAPATGSDAIAPLIDPKTSKEVDDEPPAASGEQAFAPSFNCAKAHTGQEVLICGDRALAALDVELSVAYLRARAQASDATALKKRQLEWMKFERGACSDKACLVEAYQRRLAELAP